MLVRIATLAALAVASLLVPFAGASPAAGALPSTATAAPRAQCPDPDDVALEDYSGMTLEELVAILAEHEITVGIDQGDGTTRPPTDEELGQTISSNGSTWPPGTCMSPGGMIGVVLKRPILASLFERIMTFVVSVIALVLAYVAWRVFRLERELRARP